MFPNLFFLEFVIDYHKKITLSDQQHLTARIPALNTFKGTRQHKVSDAGLNKDSRLC